MRQLKKQEDRVFSCISNFQTREQYNVDYIFIIDAEDAAIGSLVALYMEPNGLPVWVALVEIMSRNSAGSCIGVPIWADLYKRDVLKLEEYCYPHVKMTTNIPRTLVEQYMKADGGNELSHVLEDAGSIIVTYRIQGLPLPWVACRLDKTTQQWDEIDRTLTLDDMKDLLIQYIGRRDVILDWGKSGAQVFNVLDYEVVGDGVTDNVVALNKLFKRARTGDVIHFPPDSRYLLTEAMVIPMGVRVDCQPDTILKG